MGCDIHLYTEQRVNGAWVSIDQWKKEGSRVDVPWDRHFYDDRNYNLFAILADVRNDGGRKFRPICDPKGLPADASPKVAQAAKDWDCDGHSHSWLTIREILDYDWNQKATLSGLVQADAFRRWKNCGAPDSWCRDAYGASVRHVSVAEMDELITQSEAQNDSKLLDGVYCRVEWDRYYHECIGTFPVGILRALHGVAPEDVRFVFWFDN